MPPFEVYEFKIQLRGIKPKIWRKIMVPKPFNFAELHLAIQAAMGWKNYHLYNFEMNGEVISNDDEEDYDRADLNADDELIADYFIDEGDMADYNYDYGDGWSHKVILTRIYYAADFVKYPICVDGRRACPPEGEIWSKNIKLTILDFKFR